MVLPEPFCDAAEEPAVHRGYQGMKRNLIQFRLSRIKQNIKKKIPYTVVIGVASPTRAREAWGSRDIKTDTGILTQKADVIPCIITGILFPQPLKYPILLNRIQVRIQSGVNPLR